MWAEDDDVSKNRTGVGGGFDISGYDSPIAGPSNASKPSRGPGSIFSVSIKQLLESPEDGLIIAGNAVSMVTVVGIVKAIEKTSTKIIYTVEDWSGSINGLQWLEGDEDDDETVSNVVEDTYCRMSGTKRVQEGKVCMFIYNIVPIENMMEITYHYLQVIYIPLKAEQLNQEQMDVSQAQPQPFMKVQMSASYGNDSAGSAFSNLNLNPQQMRVYRVLQQCTSESGIDSKGIQAMMTVKMPVGDIDKVLEYLVNEGHIYATIDDNHFRATDLVS